jgi:hypothetical protein
VQFASYNVGYRNKIEFYDEIAQNPDEALEGVEILCKVDEERES